MQCIPTDNHPAQRLKQAGLTLIEVLIVAPLLILLIGTVIGYIVSLTGSSLQTGDKNSVVQETQASLDNIEAETTKATSFFQTSGSTISPQGSNDSTAAWSTTMGGTNGNTSTNNILIMNVPAVDKSPLDSSRQLVMFDVDESAPCNYGEIFPVMVIYYIKTNELWKRTIISSEPGCGTSPAYSTIWQRPSCTPGYTNTTVCKAEDEKLMSGISELKTEFFSDAAGTTPVTNPAIAASIKVTITASKVSGGETVSYTSTMQTVSSNIRL